MIKLENYEVMGWEHAIRGMRNPMNSWEKMDSFECVEDIPIFGECEDCPFNHGEEPYNVCTKRSEVCKWIVGPNDHELMMKLAKGGPVHAKYRRMITVYVDITAPLYWWKEFDTYKVGTVANSCSTMHKIHAKEFTLDDFSHEHLLDDRDLCWNKDLMAGERNISTPLDMLIDAVFALNVYRERFLEAKAGKTSIDAIQAKEYWWQMIQLLPSSYNQKRTVMLNYEVLAGIYPMRKNHKLDEWVEFCKWIEQLPYSEIIIEKGGTEE